MSRSHIALALCLLSLPALRAGAQQADDWMAYHNAATATREELLPGFDPARCVQLTEARLNGWGFSSLVVTPSARPGVLAAFEDAAPLGFSRADAEAAVVVQLKALPGGSAWLSGVLDPVGLKFRHEVRPDAEGSIRIPIPAPCLPAGDYSLKVCLRCGEVADYADLPITIGPYLRRDRFHTYSWNSGGSTEAHLQQQIRWAKLVGLDVLDTTYLPAVSALREGLWVSAHHVTIYQGDVAGKYMATAPYTDMARAQAQAIGDMARRYRHILWCIANSEYGSDHMLQDAAYETALQKAVGVGFDRLRLDTKDYPIPAKDLPALSPGVYAHDLPEIAAHRFARSQGQGWFELNRQFATTLRQRAPWLTVWTDPVFTPEQFEGFDAVSFWQYENDPRETMVRCQQAECVRRANSARQVFLTLSQWYCDVTPPDINGGWGLRSPDQHRFEGWLTLCCPVQALGYWEIGQLEANPDCAAGLRDMINHVLDPYGTLLGPAEVSPAPVAVYVSTVGEFLGRAHRPLNFWFFCHYLHGLLPALFERFGCRVDWVDDADVLAGRLSQYRLVLCPLFSATTDTLLVQLKAYQQAGGLLAGDEFWGVEALRPTLTFPGKLPSAYGIPYANADLPRWHRANREAIMQWQPEGLPGLDELLDVRASSPDVYVSRKELGPVTWAVAANGRFRKGAFSEKHGYTNENFRDEGLAQEVELWVRAPVEAVVYDVLHSRRLRADEYTRQGDRFRLRAQLEPGGGALFAFQPSPIVAIEVSLGGPGPVAPGTVVPLTVTPRDDGGRPIRGRTAVWVEVHDEQGTQQDVSGYYPVTGGQATIRFGIPLDAARGRWQVQVRDLTSGLATGAMLPVG